MTAIGGGTTKNIRQNQYAGPIVETPYCLDGNSVDLTNVLVRLDIDCLNASLLALEQVHRCRHESVCQRLMHKKEYAYHLVPSISEKKNVPNVVQL